MPANTSVVVPLTPVTTWGTVTTANTAKDGTGTVTTVYTAGSNGSRVEKITVNHLGTNVQTVLRIFVNNGTTNATPANNTLRKEMTIQSWTLSETVGQQETVIPLDIALAAGYKLNVTIGTTVAAGLQVTCEGGDF